MYLNFNQAKKLNPALSPNPFSFIGLEWLPLKEVNDLESDKKYGTSIELLDKWIQQKKLRRLEQKEKYKNSSATSKVFEISLGVLSIILFITSFLNIPPASIVINYYCELFNTNEYNPMLIGCIMIIPLLLPILIIKKQRGST